MTVTCTYVSSIVGVLEQMVDRDRKLYPDPWRLAANSYEPAKRVNPEIARSVLKRGLVTRRGNRYAITREGKLELKRRREKGAPATIDRTARRCPTHGDPPRRCSVDGVIFYPCCDGAEHDICSFCRSGDQQYRDIARSGAFDHRHGVSQGATSLSDARRMRACNTDSHGDEFVPKR